MNEDELYNIVNACIKGERSSQKRIFDLFSPRMMTVCLRYTRNHADAEDVLQDGFVKVFVKIKQFGFKGSFEGWIRKIMVNSALRFLEKRKNFLPLEEGRIGESTTDTLDEVSDGKRILDVIKILPEGYKNIINLYIFEGYDHSEISEILGITSSTSRSQLTKARKYLKLEMKKRNIL